MPEVKKGGDSRSDHREKVPVVDLRDALRKLPPGTVIDRDVTLEHYPHKGEVNIERVKGVRLKREDALAGPEIAALLEKQGLRPVDPAVGLKFLSKVEVKKGRSYIFLGGAWMKPAAEGAVPYAVIASVSEEGGIRIEPIPAGFTFGGSKSDDIFVVESVQAQEKSGSSQERESALGVRTVEECKVNLEKVFPIVSFDPNITSEQFPHEGPISLEDVAVIDAGKSGRGTVTDVLRDIYERGYAPVDAVTMLAYFAKHPDAVRDFDNIRAYKGSSTPPHMREMSPDVQEQSRGIVEVSTINLERRGKLSVRKGEFYRQPLPVTMRPEEEGEEEKVGFMVRRLRPGEPFSCDVPWAEAQVKKQLK